MLISEAFDVYIERKISSKNRSPRTVMNYQETARSLTRCLRDIPVGSLTVGQISKWDREMAERNNAPMTRKMHLSRVRQVARFLRKLGITTLDPEDIDLPHTVENEIEVVGKDEVARMIHHATSLRDKLLISLLFSTACRASEALSINRTDVCDTYVRVLGKFHKYRPVVLDIRTQVLMEQYIASRTDEHPALFLSAMGTRMTYARAWQIVSRTASKAGVTKRVSPHTLRHSHATQLMENGVHIRVIQQHLGHRWVTTTQHYTHVSDKFLVDSIRSGHEY
jgi:integrase/recombinase XerD